MRIQDKVAVVAGAGSGIGLATARRFVTEGAKVVAVDWHAEAIAAAVADIGGAIVGMTGDISKEADCVAMIDRAVAEYGRIDILVNNAGVMDLFSRLPMSTMNPGTVACRSMSTAPCLPCVGPFR